MFVSFLIDFLPLLFFRTYRASSRIHTRLIVILIYISHIYTRPIPLQFFFFFKNLLTQLLPESQDHNHSCKIPKVVHAYSLCGIYKKSDIIRMLRGR